MPAKVTYPPNEPLPTLGELRAGDVSVYIRCTSCFNPKWIKPAQIRGDDSRTLADVAARARCSHCRSVDRVEVSLIPEHWVRYLRATGQQDRLPEKSDVYFPPGQPQGWPAPSPDPQTDAEPVPRPEHPSDGATPAPHSRGS